MYQEKSSKLFLSRFPLQSPFAPCLWIGHCPLSGGKENTFPSGTRCHIPERCAMVTLCMWGVVVVLVQMFRDLSSGEPFCLCV